MNIADHTFLVTGGASGLGAGAARTLAAAGGRVVIADLNAEAGERLAAELGTNVAFVTCDVTSEAAVQAAIDLARSRFGALHGVVHCAGIIAGARVLGREGPHPLDLFRRVIEVNLNGTFNVLRLAAAAMAANPPEEDGERGAIVMTASISAFEGQIGQAAYAAAKGGVAALVLPAARELAKQGIRVVAIAPGIFETPMVTGLTAELQASLASQIPFPARLGRAEEFGSLAKHIFENRMLNGTVLRLDGAIRMGAK